MWSSWSKCNELLRMCPSSTGFWLNFCHCNDSYLPYRGQRDMKAGRQEGWWFCEGANHKALRMCRKLCWRPAESPPRTVKDSRRCVYEDPGVTGLKRRWLPQRNPKPPPSRGKQSAYRKDVSPKIIQPFLHCSHCSFTQNKTFVLF